jgi:DNA polymerase III alpha subunit (gram-positive type)
MLPYNQKYIVFDTETEGLNLFSSRPWQLAWIVCQGNRVIEKHDEYISYPDLKLNDTVIKLTGFNFDYYNKKKKNPKEVWEKFKSYLYNDDYIIVGQNILGFDVYMIAILQRLLGEKPDYSYLNRIYDTRCLGKAFREKLDKPKCDFLSWQYKIMHDRSLKSKVSQIQQLKFFGIEFDENKLHEAVYDCEMCFKVFLEIKKNMEL